MTLDDQRKFINSETWRTKVGLLAVKAALAVAAESGATDHHAIRATLATAVLQDKTGEWAMPFTKAVAVNPGLSASPSEADLEFSVNAAWNGMAGAPGPD